MSVKKLKRWAKNERITRRRKVEIKKWNVKEMCKMTWKLLCYYYEFVAFVSVASWIEENISGFVFPLALSQGCCWASVCLVITASLKALRIRLSAIHPRSIFSLVRFVASDCDFSQTGSAAHLLSWLERRANNAKVAGSIPSLSVHHNSLIFFNEFLVWYFFCFSYEFLQFVPFNPL